MHKIHEDTQNFDAYYDGFYYSGIELLYPGNTLNIGSDKQIALVVTGPSGAGKDTVVDYIVENYKDIEQVRTATTRLRRFEFTAHADTAATDHLKKALEEAGSEEEKEHLLEDAEQHHIIFREPKSKYVWMREKKGEESDDEYISNLVREYDLIEHDYHYGNLYGIPRASIREITDRGKTPLFRVDVSGAINIHNLLSEEFNVVVITVLPDKIDDILKRLEKRSNARNTSGENVAMRENAMKKELSEYSIVTNFYLHNTAIKKDGVPGLKRVFEAVSLLLKELGFSL